MHSQNKYSYTHNHLTSLGIITISIIPAIPLMMLHLSGIPRMKPHLLCLLRRVWGRCPCLTDDGLLVVIFLFLNNRLALVVCCCAGADGGVMCVVDGGPGSLALEVHVVACVGEGGGEEHTTPC